MFSKPVSIYLHRITWYVVSNSTDTDWLIISQNYKSLRKGGDGEAVQSFMNKLVTLFQLTEEGSFQIDQICVLLIYIHSFFVLLPSSFHVLAPAGLGQLYYQSNNIDSATGPTRPGTKLINYLNKLINCLIKHLIILTTHLLNLINHLFNRTINLIKHFIKL